MQLKKEKKKKKKKKNIHSYSIEGMNKWILTYFEPPDSYF
jgi:hypothetical protein